MRLFEAGEIDPLISETRRPRRACRPRSARLGSRGTYGKVVCEL